MSATALAWKVEGSSGAAAPGTVVLWAAEVTVLEEPDSTTEDYIQCKQKSNKVRSLRTCHHASVLPMVLRSAALLLRQPELAVPATTIIVHLLP